MAVKPEVILGDITTLAVDVIVNAANPSLLGGGGVDGAIHRAAGPELLAACKIVRQQQGECAPGHAVITTAGQLPASAVIHAVGPVWHGGDRQEAELLADATLWTSRSANARNQAFNINNGDLWRWSELWPVIAAWFELEIGPPVSLSFRQMFQDYRALWRQIAEEHALIEADILALSDGAFADFIFGWNYDMFGDGSKLRRAGFQGYRATDEMFCDLFARFRAARVIP